MLSIAKYLDARAVVTIPDFSYDKTFVSLFSGLDCGIYEDLHEAFCRECRRMSDLMIDITKKPALEYKVDDYVIFHGRDGILDITTGKGMAANAGHEHPAVRRAGGNFELVNDLESVTDTGRDV